MTKDNKPTRGFEYLIGKKVVGIDTSAINIVRLTLESGTIVEVNADDQHMGIAIVKLTDCDGNPLP